MNNATLLHDIAVPRQDHGGQLVKGWALSIALHGCLMLAVMTAMPKLTLTLESEPFRWEVALVQAPASSSTVAAPPQVVPESALSKPIQPKQQPARQSEPSPQAATKPIQRQEVAQPVQREIEPIQRDIQPVQKTVEAVQRDLEPVRREVQPIQRESQPKVATDQPVPSEPAREVVPIERATAEIQESKRAERTAEPLVSEPARDIAAAVEQQTSQTAPMPVETRESPAPVIQHRMAETTSEPQIVARTPAMEAPTSAPVIERPAPVEQAAVSEPTQPAPASPSPTAEEAVAPPSVPPAAAATSDQPAPTVQEQPPVVARSVTPSPGRKTDYGWLAESLHRRIVEVRQYPSTARLNGWEGKVVLRVAIRQDGHLHDVSVVKSSGHETLDNAAMEAVRRACPLHMKHEVSSPMVVVQVPINYSLNR
jgi:protein TonB